MILSREQSLEMKRKAQFLGGVALGAFPVRSAKKRLVCLRRVAVP
jgi:hypothetical protein